jgi:putative ABC transport system permease protein
MISVPAHDILRLAAASLQRNALRSVLAALGIAVGVAAVVAMVTIGRGSRAEVDAQISQLGMQLLTLRVGQDTRGGKGVQIEAKPMTYADVEAVRGFQGELQAVAPIASASVRVVSRQANWVAAVTGADNEFFVARRWDLASGESSPDKRYWRAGAYASSAPRFMTGCLAAAPRSARPFVSRACRAR